MIQLPVSEALRMMRRGCTWRHVRRSLCLTHEQLCVVIRLVALRERGVRRHR